jgi:hypothetical protein
MGRNGGGTPTCFLNSGSRTTSRQKLWTNAQSFHPEWQWSIATFCIWPNETVTVLVYGNYTINFEGLTCSRTGGLLYAVNINLTNL